MLKFILNIFILLAYDQPWWYTIIPFLTEYTYASVGCGTLFFWLYVGSSVGMIISIFTMMPWLIILMFLAMMVFYSIILFGVFTNTDQMSAKISALVIFVADVVLGLIGGIPTIVELTTYF